MTELSFPLVFDGHNDALFQLTRRSPADAVDRFVTGDHRGHIDLPRMRAGGFGGGLFAVWIHSPFEPGSYEEKPEVGGYDMALPAPVVQADALPQTFHMASLLMQIEARSDETFRVCRSVADIRAAMAGGSVAAVLHFEGAEAIDPDFQALDVFHAAGLRSLGPVWSRPTIYGEGVPFRFPSSPDTGGGLTEAGKALVKACNARHIAVDLSHITEKGFWDVAATSEAPLIASHSNVHDICPHARNLTEKQMHAVRDSGGIVGLNFATQFLRPDGRRGANMSLDLMLRHLDRMIETMGVEHVGFGSDFDGAEVPQDIGDVAGLPRLLQAMHDHGYDEETIAMLAHGNWLRVLEETWGA